MRFDAIIFDVGNTLAPWREEHGRTFLGALRTAFEETCGPMAEFDARAAAARDRLLLGRADDFREVTCAEFCEAVLRAPAPPGLLKRVEERAHAAVLDILRVPEGTGELLALLGRKRPLAVLSNFFLARPIVDALDRGGILDAFVHVEVSAMGGWMKPHPAPFETVRERLGTPMERTLMVGDDFWADIVGGHRAGLLTALTHEHREGPVCDPRAPEVTADRILRRLDELEG